MVQSADIPAVHRAFEEIAELDKEAAEAAARDGFGATLGGRYIERKMSADSRAALRLLILRTAYQRIAPIVARCSALGIDMSDYGDEDDWIAAKLALLPEVRT